MRIITEPLGEDTLSEGPVAVRGAAYAGEAGIDRVEVTPDGGRTWSSAKLIGPSEPFAWRRWEYTWDAKAKGEFTIMARAMDTEGNRQPENACWNVLGYGNNGVREHAIVVRVV
jgi:sulfite dehydrogenase